MLECSEVRVSGIKTKAKPHCERNLARVTVCVSILEHWDSALARTPSRQKPKLGTRTLPLELGSVLQQGKLSVLYIGCDKYTKMLTTEKARCWVYGKI